MLRRLTVKPAVVYSRQMGLSLIELMVALVLGLFLTAGILQVFIGSRQAANVVQAQTAMQESARFGFYFINGSIRQAGYLNAGDVRDNGFFPRDLVSKFRVALLPPATAEDMAPFVDHPWPQSSLFQGGAVIAGEDNYSSGGSSSVSAKPGSDMLVVRSMGEADPDRPEMLDCEGVVMPVDDAVSTMFFVGDDNQLYCQVDDRPAVALVAGIENMQVEYGMASSSAGAAQFQVDHYADALTIAGTEWPQVMSVRVGLLARSELVALDREPQELVIFDTTATMEFTDGRARQVFTQTISLRGNLSN